jgi:hypothetical protein
MPAEPAALDFSAALQVLASYAYAVDDRDLHALNALVTEDIFVERTGGNLVGRTAFLSYYRDLRSRNGRDHHVISNVLLDRWLATGTTLRSYFVNYRRQDGRLYLIQGRYKHLLVEEPTRIRIRRIHIELTSVGLLPAEFPAWTGAT